MSRDHVEYYCENALLVMMESSIVPSKGSFISIRKETYEVVSISYACDYIDQSLVERTMRANVDLVLAKTEKQVKRTKS